jgi:hypothetical protein
MWPPPHHLRMETDPVSKTLCSLEYRMINEVQKLSNHIWNFVEKMDVTMIISLQEDYLRICCNNLASIKGRTHATHVNWHDSHSDLCNSRIHITVSAQYHATKSSNGYHDAILCIMWLNRNPKLLLLIPMCKVTWRFWHTFQDVAVLNEKYSHSHKEI